MTWIGRRAGDGGRYEVERALGEGTMGQVFLGRDSRLNRRVVLKVLSPALAANPRVRQRFANEGEIQANLLHDHIVRVVDAFDEAETSVIVMDFVDGPTVEDHLQQVGGRLSFARVHAIIAPVCDAVGYAHAHGVIHRDLKPANILLDLGRGFEVPKVADFGIAKIAADGSTRTRAGAVMGTPAFMPPEQLLGAADLDHRADIYALGVVLYQLTTGQLPYGDATEYEVTHKVLSGVPIDAPSLHAPSLPAGFDAVIAKATAHDRAVRYASMAALRAGLDALLMAQVAAPVTGDAPEPATAPVTPTAAVESPTAQAFSAPAEPPKAPALAYEAELRAAPPPKRGWLPWLGAGAALTAGVVLAVVVGGGGDGEAADSPQQLGVVAAAEAASARRQLGAKGWVRVAPGTFRMGSPSGEAGRDDDDEGAHPVRIGRAFLLKATEVTQAEYEQLMGSNPSRYPSCGGTCPVEQVSWFDAVEYANALSVTEGLPECYVVNGKDVTFRGLGCGGYRLPTEAEWEYAARAGSAQATYNGNLTLEGDHHAPELDAIGWYGGNSGVTYSGGWDCSGWSGKQHSSSKCGTHPVGKKRANAWGLYDMLGNVWEWTQDVYAAYPPEVGTRVDPVGSSSSIGSGRVVRGGSWRSDARHVRAASRGRRAPGYRDGYLGFRLARSLER